MDPAIASVLVATIAAVASIVCAYLINKTHKAVNSRMDEMLALTRTSSLAEGVEQQRVKQEAP
jgi:hypothetical protein